MTHKAVLLFLVFTLFTPVANALTLHLDVTPQLAGTSGVVMKRVDDNHTRFTIRCRMLESEITGNARYPVVRGGYLNVHGKNGRLVRAPIRSKRDGDSLVFSFELENNLAKNSVFIYSIFREDGQVGGGSIHSYRLINFIDPDHERKALLKRIEKSRKEAIQSLQTKLRAVKLPLIGRVGNCTATDKR